MGKKKSPKSEKSAAKRAKKAASLSNAGNSKKKPASAKTSSKATAASDTEDEIPPPPRQTVEPSVSGGDDGPPAGSAAGSVGSMDGASQAPAASAVITSRKSKKSPIRTLIVNPIDSASTSQALGPSGSAPISSTQSASNGGQLQAIGGDAGDDYVAAPPPVGDDIAYVPAAGSAPESCVQDAASVGLTLAAPESCPDSASASAADPVSKKRRTNASEPEGAASLDGVGGVASQDHPDGSSSTQEVPGTLGSIDGASQTQAAKSLITTKRSKGNSAQRKVIVDPLDSASTSPILGSSGSAPVSPTQPASTGGQLPAIPAKRPTTGGKSNQALRSIFLATPLEPYGSASEEEGPGEEAAVGCSSTTHGRKEGEKQARAWMIEKKRLDKEGAGEQASSSTEDGGKGKASSTKHGGKDIDKQAKGTTTEKTHVSKEGAGEQASSSTEDGGKGKASSTKHGGKDMDKQAKDGMTEKTHVSKRHGKVKKDAIEGLSKNEILKLARQAGVTRLGGGVYQELRLHAQDYLDDLLFHTLVHTEYRGARIVTPQDAIAGFKSMGGGSWYGPGAPGA